MAEQFCRLTPAELKQMYHSGQLPAEAYLKLLLGAKLKPGWKLNIESVEDFCREWGFTRSTFYRARRKLQAQGLLRVQAGRLSLEIPQVRHMSHTWESCLTDETPSATDETPSLTDETKNLTDETRTGLEPRAGAGSSDSPDSYRLDQIFSGETAEFVSTNQADLSYLRFLDYRRRNPWKRLTGEGIERELVENPDPKIKFHWLKTVPSVLSPWWGIEFNPLAELPPGDPTSPKSEPHLGNTEQSPAGIGGDS